MCNFRTTTDTTEDASTVTLDRSDGKTLGIKFAHVPRWKKPNEDTSFEMAR